MTGRVIVMFALLHGTVLGFGALFVVLALRGSRDADDAQEPESREDGDGGLGSPLRHVPKPRGGGGGGLRRPRPCMRLHGPLGSRPGSPPRFRPQRTIRPTQPSIH